MNRNWLYSITVLIFLTSMSSALIPKPYEYNQTTKLCNIVEALDITNEYYSCFILKEALKRFDERLAKSNTPLPSNDPADCVINSLTIQIEQSCDETENKLWPSDMMDESYSLNIADGVIGIYSQEIWGTLHALETILQLVYRSESDSKVMYEGAISDVPVFTHRGIMIDTARHYLSISEIEKMIDAMSMVKMNVLHWHVTDDESFPMAITAFPDLSTQGSFNYQLMTYQRNDVDSLIEFARLRGVRVLPEFETP
uniref:beta-N-acetylhexosaminidase n=1 Tax=Trichobilharzia regenti TaxID=157069 RepID=A0AA85JER9_TRIRE